MYCGTEVPESEISPEAKVTMHTSNVPSSSNASSAKATGAALIIIGMILDIVSIIMIVSSSYGAFGIVTAIGTILFIIGIALVANG